LLRKGFWQKREWEQQVIRKAVELVVAPWVKMGFDIRRYWPLPVDKKLADGQVDEALKTLNYLKQNDGKFIYKKVNGVIIEVPINAN